MNLKPKMGVLALAMLALAAMTPTVAADGGEPEQTSSAVALVTITTEICVYTTGPQGCGAMHDSILTIKDDTLGCITSHPQHLNWGC